VTPRQPTVIGTDASSSFVCDYVAGVNRVLSLPPYLLVDNIGRNVELWRFQSSGPEPTARTLYDRTSYPDDPIASLLDVDLHAAFLRRDGHELLTINHYGRARRFDLPAPAAHMEPAGELQLLGDTERVVLAGDCLVASSPRGEFTDDASQPGIFFFEPLTTSWDGPAPDAIRRLDSSQALADWGVISALTVTAHATRLAVAAGPRLGVFNLLRSAALLRLGECRWETALTFHCQWLHFDETGRLWTGGHRSSATDSTDWDACRGGGLASFTDESGVPHFAVALPDETAWGYGADPLVLANDHRAVYVLGRDASLHVVDVNSRSVRQIHTALDGPTGAATTSLGIGHAALRGDWLYAGFSRGGFRLLRYDVGESLTSTGV
jgi:hypothetical protein